MKYEDINKNFLYKINNSTVEILNKNDSTKTVDIFHINTPSGGLCINVDPSNIMPIFQTKLPYQYKVGGNQ